MDVRISRCGAADIDAVPRFIAAHWKRGHILAACRPLLDWQHRDAGGYSFVSARRGTDNAVLGILGFIDTARFDAALQGDNVLWLTTWKVREDAGVSGLGLQLLQHVMRTVPHHAVGALFPDATTTPIYKAMGFQVGELAHYVRTAATEASRSSLDARPLVSDDDFRALEWSDPEPRVPRKTPEYFRRRYARHPLYRYSVTAFFEGGRPRGLLAARVADHAGTRALRIVDLVGPHDVVERLGPVVDALIATTGASYADLYNAGLDAGALARAGFRAVDPDGAEIVPDNFEPFEKRNVRLWFAFKGADRPVLFKGDSDRDRPNRVTATS